MDQSEKDREVERKKEQVLKKLRRSLDLGELTPEGLNAAARKQKRRENKNSENYVPRGPTGYNLYSDSVRAAVAQKFEHRDVMGQIAIKWKALSQNERDAWIEKARKQKLRDSSPGRAKSGTKKSPRKSSKRTPKSKGSAKKSAKAKRNSGRARKSS
jgi:Holliday junction resolvase RusA-like endonuclease